MAKMPPRGRRQERRGPPVGYLKAEFADLQSAGCIQCETNELEPMFTALMLATRCNPCGGCPKWQQRGDECKAFRLYHSAWRNKQQARDRRIAEATQPRAKNSDNAKFYNLSVAQIAERLGISKSEVRRRKVAGTLSAPQEAL